MDINQVKFGNYSIGASFSGTQNKESNGANETQVNVNQQNKPKQMDVDGMFNAMNIAGLQNKAQINRAETKMVNPSDYLSEERISEIEAMMAGFESGVNAVANTIEGEFPGVFADSQKFALAANIYANQG